RPTSSWRFFWESISSITTSGITMSFSSKAESASGSCNSTLVSRTYVLASRHRLRGARGSVVAAILLRQQLRDLGHHVVGGSLVVNQRLGEMEGAAVDQVRVRRSRPMPPLGDHLLTPPDRHRDDGRP